MRKLMTMMILAVGCFALAAEGREETRTFQVGSGAELDIRNISGTIKITQGDNGQVEVSYKLRDDRITVEMEQDGDSITVNTKYPRNVRNIKGGVDYEVRVPANCDVKANSVSGAITLNDVAGKVEVNNVSGAIKATDIFGSIEANSVSGSLNLKNIDASNVDANTTSGAITYEGTMGGRNYDFNSVSGSITLKVDQANFEVDGNTLSGGVTADGFENITVNRAKYGPNTSISGSAGNGDADLSLNTVSGSITIKRR